MAIKFYFLFPNQITFRWNTAPSVVGSLLSLSHSREVLSSRPLGGKICKRDEPRFVVFELSSLSKRAKKSSSSSAQLYMSRALSEPRQDNLLNEPSHELNQKKKKKDSSTPPLHLSDSYRTRRGTKFLAMHIYVCVHMFQAKPQFIMCELKLIPELQLN